MLYNLTYAHYDTNVEHLFDGPEVECWASFCNSLIDEAKQNALKYNNDSWIGWSEIIDSLCVVLESKGYRQIRPETAIYFGANIIDDNDVHITSNNEDFKFDNYIDLEDIKEHNRLLKEKQHRELMSSAIDVDKKNYNLIYDKSLTEEAFHYLLHKINVRHSLYQYELKPTSGQTDLVMKLHVPIDMAPLFYALNRHENFDFIFAKNQELGVVIRTHNYKTVLCFDYDLKDKIVMEYEHDKFEIDILNADILIPQIDFAEFYETGTVREFIEQFYVKFVGYSKRFAADKIKVRVPLIVFEWFDVYLNSCSAGFSPIPKEKLDYQILEYTTQNQAITFICDKVFENANEILFDNGFKIELVNFHIAKERTK